MNHNKNSDQTQYSYRYYRKVLEALQESFDANYVVSEIPQIFSQIMRPKFIIRHDIHQCLDKGLKLAQIEKEYSIRASYMINIFSPHYDLKEKDNLSKIKEIIDLGHEIGLYIHHASLDTSHPNQIILKEKELLSQCIHLEALIHKKIHSVSFPKDFSDVPKNSFFISQKVSASSKTLMSGALSDQKDFEDPQKLLSIIKNYREKILQLLIHPEKWNKD